MGDLGLIPGLGKFPVEGHGNLLQYSHQENSLGQRSLEGYTLPVGEAWQTTVPGVTESHT